MDFPIKGWIGFEKRKSIHLWRAAQKAGPAGCTTGRAGGLGKSPPDRFFV